MTIFAIILVFMVLLGVFTLAYQMYKLILLDATSRGLKHPTFWAIFSLGGSSRGNLILYLIGRNKYPSDMDEATAVVFDSRKRKTGLSICFIAVGTIGLIFIALFGNL